MESIENFIEDIPPQLSLKMAYGLAMHPMEVCKVLIQIGHEPIAPVPTKTLVTRKPALRLPSVFEYMGHIRRKEGISGLYRGITPRLSNILLNYYTAEKFDELFPPEELTDEEEDKLTQEEKVQKFGKETLRLMANRAVCVILTQPLQVLAVRAISEFVGGEKNYSDWSGGIVSGVVATIRENGLFGLWSGMQPRMVGELLFVAISGSVTFGVKNYVLDKKNPEQRAILKYVDNISSYVAQSLTYPFTVVSTCMTVSRSGLAAGYPPFMPLYMGWTDCYSHLRSQNQLKRGTSLFFRYYTGPQAIVGDKILAVSSNMFKPPK
eukprot:TRINITY_DN3230_c0_g1_i1.p1 TRINITY_DN3230_c0_g1~~TRINITY_DN3230_c0_g1_i1.p1  ORF type:complete len:322 (+),score=78.96 TRINITY_DN3230_c0_g1_i1:76-1041(+)